MTEVDLDVLVRVDEGSHRSRARWTRHGWDGKKTWCGLYPDPVNTTSPTSSVQGRVTLCKRCDRYYQRYNQPQPSR